MNNLDFFQNSYFIENDCEDFELLNQLNLKFLFKSLYIKKLLKNKKKVEFYSYIKNYYNKNFIVESFNYIFKTYKLLNLNYSLSIKLNIYFLYFLKININLFFFFKSVNFNNHIINYNKLIQKKYSNYNFYNISYKISIEDSIGLKKYWDDRFNTLLTLKKPVCSNEKLLFKRVAILDLILKRFLESKLESKIFLTLDRYSIVTYKTKNILIHQFLKKLKRIWRVLRGTQISLKTFFLISMIFVYTKDIDLYFRLLTEVFQQMSFKNHKRFLYYLKLYMTRTLVKYYRSSKFLGFYFYIRGKISCTGNSKTRTYIISYRKHSFSNKMLKIKLKKGLIYTKTGVLGFTIIAAYR